VTAIDQPVPGYWSDRLYIQSPKYDWFWIILSPLWAISLGLLMSQGLFQTTASFFDTTESAAFFFYMAITQGHLLITVFRTHANQAVLQRFFWRFTLIPMFVWFGAVSSHWLFVGLFVLMTFWDVYHSALQVFGLGRIYDRKAGNDPNSGRLADYMLCLLMYAGPILSGSLLIDHLTPFKEFGNVDDLEVMGTVIVGQMFTSIPETVVAEQPLLRMILFGIAAVTVIVYGVSLVRLTRTGYKMPLTKAVFFLGTAVTCVFAWGFNSFGMGFLIANLFHAIQYFALVWVMEQKSIADVFGAGQSLHRVGFRLGCYLAIPLTLGFLSVCFDSVIARATLITCALMHFWWDGFIWSVRSEDGLVQAYSKN
jgi:hypothetical protein